jgi:AI-2 transport protein TqsA
MIPISTNTPGARFLLMGASFVIVVAGLREGASILLPFALALFLAVMSMPLMFWLQLRRVPAPLAIMFTMLVIGLVFGALIMLGTQAVADFQGQLPVYRASVVALYASWVASLSTLIGIQLDQYVTFELIDPGAAFDLFGRTAQRVAAFLTNTFLVLLIMAFILSEAMVFPFKFRAIVAPQGGDRRRVTKMVPNDRRRMTKIIREVQVYLGIKTLMSLTTGLLIGVLAWIAGLDFPILLGIIGFVLNYIPTVGSILAAVPALILSVVQFGTIGNFVLVVVGYGAINVVFGNIIEPSLMGRRLGLSTLVVILSLLFWAWVWGPVGALLAVPLTMVVKIMLENTEDLRWMAILLDKSSPQMEPSYAIPSPSPAPGPSESTTAGSFDDPDATDEGAGAAAGDEEVS